MVEHAVVILVWAQKHGSCATGRSAQHQGDVYSLCDAFCWLLCDVEDRTTAVRFGYLPWIVGKPNVEESRYSRFAAVGQWACRGSNADPIERC
jgi:hypothetical protein